MLIVTGDTWTGSKENYNEKFKSHSDKFIYFIEYHIIPVCSGSTMGCHQSSPGLDFKLISNCGWVTGAYVSYQFQTSSPHWQRFGARSWKHQKYTTNVQMFICFRTTTPVLCTAFHFVGQLSVAIHCDNFPECTVRCKLLFDQLHPV